ncbi:MAG: hypothetical protein MZV70_35175 [Desulfobacterales bacterium]|nr:hypothetical protein [Desulfobacterales bacterium]
MNTLRALEEALDSFAGCGRGGQPRPLVPRPRLHPHPGLRGRGGARARPGNWSELRGVPAAEALGASADRPHRYVYRKLETVRASSARGTPCSPVPHAPGSCCASCTPCGLAGSSTGSGSSSSCPTSGGLAYLIVEILPGLSAAAGDGWSAAQACDGRSPGARERSSGICGTRRHSPDPWRIKDRSARTPWRRRGPGRKRWAEHEACLGGLARNSPALLYKAAAAAFEAGEPEKRGSGYLGSRLPRKPDGSLRAEGLEPPCTCGSWSAPPPRKPRPPGYERVRTLANDREIDCLYLEFLERTGGTCDRLEAVLESDPGRGGVPPGHERTLRQGALPPGLRRGRGLGAGRSRGGSGFRKNRVEIPAGMIESGRSRNPEEARHDPI